MNKILTVAKREYGAAVKTKTFLVSLLLMPLLMLGGVMIQRKTQSIVDSSDYRVAVIDRTEGGSIGKAILRAAERREAVDRIDKKTGKPGGPSYKIELVEPAPADDPAAIDRQRLELAGRTRSNELLAYVEIGPKVIEPDVASLMRLSSAAATQTSSDASTTELQGNFFAQLNRLPDEAIVRYSTNQPTLMAFRNWLQQAITQPVVVARMQKLGVDFGQITKVTNAIFPPPVVDRGMPQVAPDGSITYEANNASMIVNTLVPTVLVMLMFIAVMVGASPLATNIVEEKQLRIAEVLLGGLTPFQLMLGKLLGGAAVSITLAAIYFAGIFYGAQQLDVLQYVRVETMAWFVLFTLVGVMTYGSLFVAAGSAATNIKEAQATLTPVMLIVALPLFILTWIVQYPNGLLSKSASLFPLTAPTVSIIRAAIPQGATRLELILSAICSVLGMLVVIWIAGRVFRAGMLLTSKPASVREAIGWIVRG
jgi:ABC-2 type transport system permease protein